MLWAVGAWTLCYSAFLVAPACLPPRAISTKCFVWFSLLATVLAPTILAAVMVVDRSAFNFWVPVGRRQDREEFWGSSASEAWWHGPKGIHDFCEENYEYSPFVAEFHNTWSSVPIVAFGSVGSWYTRRFVNLEGRWPAAFISLGGVGVGSVLFHGTLLQWGQVLDEAPMMALLFVLLFCFIEAGKTRRFGIWLPLVLGCAFLSFMCTYLVLHIYLFFLLGFGGGAVMLVSYGGWLCIFDENVNGTKGRLVRYVFIAGLMENYIGRHRRQFEHD